jgi:hypothetical protein
MVDVSWKTIQRAMGTLGYRKCVVCTKGWVSPSNATRRYEQAEKALQLRPQPEDWYDVRWSDECHFSLGPEGKVLIIRKPGERYCPDCIQERRNPQTKHINRLHVWAAVGHDFKSELVFYEVPGNTNGKMSQKVYRDVILEGLVQSWLTRGDQFILEEDGDSGHGPGKKNNIVKQWKTAHGLKHFFNTPGSPDLSPFKPCWRIVKAHVAKFDTWTTDQLRNAILEGWEEVTQDRINRLVDKMPQVMKDVIDGKGKMTGN